MEQILRYFPELTEKQVGQLSQLQTLYADWNEKINVVSRKDIDNLAERHVLHSLAVAKYITFTDNTSILDLGCGGGFPGIPLAILFPNANFHLVDSVRKKLTVVDAVADAIGLSNIRTNHSRVEDLKEEVDFVVVRAVAKLQKLLEWSRHLIKQTHKNGLPNGFICLKGGDLKNEIKDVSKHNYVEQIPIHQYFTESFFEEKYVVYVQG